MSKQVVKESIPQNKESKKLPFALERINYQIMLGGIGLILLGFVVMSLDSEPFGFGFLGLTLGPIILFVGFLVQIAAILYKPKQEQ
jgi:hypothetical protein